MKVIVELSGTHAVAAHPVASTPKSALSSKRVVSAKLSHSRAWRPPTAQSVCPMLVHSSHCWAFIRDIFCERCPAAWRPMQNGKQFSISSAQRATASIGHFGVTTMAASAV